MPQGLLRLVSLQQDRRKGVPSLGIGGCELNGEPEELKGFFAAGLHRSALVVKPHPPKTGENRWVVDANTVCAREEAISL